MSEHLPEQDQICLSALDTILRHAFKILETSDDNREKLRVMGQVIDMRTTKIRYPC
jgi:hypothetical protein